MREKDLLKHIQGVSQRTGFSGTGDDAAVWGDWVLSTDQFIEGTHFTFSQMSAEEIGFKGVVQALSDLAAMAAKPSALLCSAAWPKDAEQNILRIYKGIEEACREYQVPLIGGDISRAPQVYLDFTVMGKSMGLEKNPRPGDVVAVTGPLGSAYAGFKTLGDADYPELARAFRRPVAHINTALSLQSSQALTGLTDISDGLAKSTYHLSTLGKCGFHIDLNQIPRSPELKKLCEARQWPLRDFLLAGGEDYQLLVTLKPGAPLLDYGLTAIGHVVEGENALIENGKIGPLPEVGWDPFVVL